MKKVIIVFLVLVLCLLCLPVASAETRMTASSPAGSGTAGQVVISSGLPIIKADEEVTTETTMEPVTYPTEEPTLMPTEEPTLVPTEVTTQPTEEPTLVPTEETTQPTEQPTLNPTEETTQPTEVPTIMPTTEETTSPVPGPYAPVADFSASPTSGSGPLTVRFTDTSINTPTMWYWDFGDGATDSSTGTPSHTYADPGSYTVTLTATNQYGSDTITKYDIVTVNGQVMANGAIFAQSVPAGATIYMNGNSYGNSPVTIPDLFPGTYSVMATLNGYSPDLRTITVYPGQTAAYYPTLRSSPNPPGTPGAIFARSTPAGADIYVSGVSYGISPLTVNNLLPGTYSVMATLNGYSADAQLVTVTAGQTAAYYPTLQPSPGPGKTGAIFAQSVPDGAAIYLNNAYYGVSPVTITDLLPSTYSMKAILSGYPTDYQKITISPGRVSFYTPTFYPAPPPIGSGQGIIAVYSNADGAQVYFDNAYEGNIAGGVLFVTVATTGTPVRSVRVENTGFIPWTGSLAQWPASGETVRVQATLVPAPVPTTTHAPLPVTVTLCALLGAGAIVLLAENRRRAR